MLGDLPQARASSADAGTKLVRPMLSSAPIWRQTPTTPQPDPNQKEDRTDRERQRQKLYIHASHLLLIGTRFLMQKTWKCKRRLLTNLGCLLDVNPLAVILQQELMAPWGILQGNAVHGPGPKHSHSSCCLKGNKGKV